MRGPAGLDWEPVTGRLYLIQRGGGPGIANVGWTAPSGGAFNVIYAGPGELFDVAVIVPEPGSLALLGGALMFAARRRNWVG